MKLIQYTREDIQDKRVLLRCDLDVKVNEEAIVDEYHDLRLERVVPTIHELLGYGAKQVVIIGHRARPKKQDSALSLAPVKDRLADLCAVDGLDEPITFIDDITVEPQSFADDILIMLENLRFWPGEKSGDEKFASLIARWGDVYVNDAFGNSHRKDASMHALPKILGKAFAGLELLSEVQRLESFMDSIKHPFVAVLGGTKISTKMPLIKFLMKEADAILLGGGLANTVLASRGINMGKSLIEESMVDEAGRLKDEKIILPTDAVVSGGKIVSVDKIGAKEAMLDIGEQASKKFAQQICTAKTILFNGPMGKFEDDEFAKSTSALAKLISSNKSANTLAGGGETVEALEKLGIVDEFDFVSTGGGAMLTFLVGGAMPGLEAVIV